uniref:Putative membrane SNARE associated-like protein n=1 Tax=uncultured marine thaumarchaeote KM3_65_H02 TaxID=1456226 RepID=A0A075HHY8_9ARCH|nr:putative membrane SNARE associated-like protein [uncultured marine thaumarchaeote KM3_65_H02]
MADIFETIIEYSYLGIFFLLIAVNAAPILMPPTWIILSSFFALDASLDPFLLAIVGATGATIGRFFLKCISGFFRRFVGKEQESNLDAIGNFLNKKKFGYTLTSFLFAATPLPSNMLFVAYGMMRAKSIGLYIGFWCGRLISYYIMITISEAVLAPLLQLFEDRIIGIIVADIIGIGVVIFFTCINWQVLLFQRKLRFVRPRLWRL